MKFINKNQEPTEFSDWKNKENENWQPTYNELQNPEKQKVFQSLLDEQGYICCYCERELKNNDYHIEHFKPKDQNEFPELQLEYANLLCSCQRNVNHGEPLHCGNSKKNWYDDNLLISPLDTDCEEHFSYRADGHIIPSQADNKKAETTIERLQLNIEKLIDLRKNAIEPFLDGDLTEEELDSFVNGYLIEKDSNNGKYNEFYTTIQYLFKK
ncbi:MAG: TIGR02646 family protein [Marinifilaceae bacterium]|jgi:uncharacterized protein (TIGR02646 family)|nr:TIGR02646 family protein [Marinifilaceae bacterium]